jgi:hypothetical protein
MSTRANFCPEPDLLECEPPVGKLDESVVDLACPGFVHTAEETRCAVSVVDRHQQILLKVSGSYEQDVPIAVPSVSEYLRQYLAIN